MSIYKKVIIPKKNLPASLESSVFKMKWLEALSLEPKAVADLIEFLNPFYSFVNHSLKNYNEPNYFLLSLLSLIDNSFDIAFSKLKEWLKDKDTAHEYRIIIFERLNVLKKIPSKSRPLMAEYYFTLDFKYALSKKIKKKKIQTNAFQLRKCNYYLISDPIENQTNWQKYLLDLLSLGYNNSEISQMTQLSRKTIINERKKIYVNVQNASNERS